MQKIFFFDSVKWSLSRNSEKFNGFSCLINERLTSILIFLTFSLSDVSCPIILQIKKNILELHTHTTNRVQNNKFAGLSREARDYRLSVSRAYTFPNH